MQGYVSYPSYPQYRQNRSAYPSQAYANAGARQPGYQRPVMPRNVAVQPAAQTGVAVSPSRSDVVSLPSRAVPALSLNERIANTRREADALFSDVKNVKQLLEKAQGIMFTNPETGESVPLKIYDGSNRETKWVNKALDKYSTSMRAFFHVPETRLYNRAHQDMPQDNYPAEYIDTLNDLSRAQQPAIFVRKHARLPVLKHELYHALQYKNGVPFSTDKKTDDAAIAFRNSFYPKTMFGKLIHPVKVAAVWLTAPLVMAKYLLSPSPDPDASRVSVGEALRTNIALEEQVDLYQMRHGSMAEKIQGLMHFLSESGVQKIRSHRKDDEYLVPAGSASPQGITRNQPITPDNSPARPSVPAQLPRFDQTSANALSSPYYNYARTPQFRPYGA